MQAILQAILTKYHGPSNTRGSYMSAKCEALSIRVSYDDALNLDENHVAACDELCRRMDEQSAKKYGSTMPGTWSKPKASGQLPTGEYAHVFIGEA